MAAKEKKGLGTGLGVLFGEDNYTDENELKLLPVSRLEPRREQPRTVFDDEALQELAESLRRYGVIQPVTARKLDNGFYQIIAGERRWRAARLAELEEIPVRVIEADDRRTAELALVENLQREDLNPIEEARGYQALIDEYGMTQEEAAQSVGRSRPAITNAIRLLSLSPAVLKMVEEGKLSAGHARALLPIEEEKAQKAAADEVLKNVLVPFDEVVAEILGSRQRQFAAFLILATGGIDAHAASLGGGGRRAEVVHADGDSLAVNRTADGDVADTDILVVSSF